MPQINKIADMVTATIPTTERGKWDAVGLAQLYPDYECVKQFVQGARVVSDVAMEIETILETDAPTSYEHSYATHPLKTNAPKLIRKIKTPLVKIRNSTTFSEDEKELQGASDSRLLDIVQVRMTKFDRDYWQGLEHDLLSLPTGVDQFPDQLRGLPYWQTDGAAVTDLDMHGSDEPVGFTTIGKGGLLKSAEAKWANAVAVFKKVAQDDFFDKVSQFLNRVAMMAVAPNPSVVSDVPARVGYVQEPLKRALERYFSVSNDNLGTDAGVYRGASHFRSVPFVIWHAMSSPESPVRPSTCVVRIVDWNSFRFQVHSAYDRKLTGPTMLPEVPGQMILVRETYHALHCSRPDRNLYMRSATPELQPSLT